MIEHDRIYHFAISVFFFCVSHETEKNYLKFLNERHKYINRFIKFNMDREIEKIIIRSFCRDN
jgi:hypothetical protein